MQTTMVDDKIDYLLRRETGVHTEVRERKVVSTLRLVLEIVPLPEPGIPKAHVAVGPPPNQLVRYLRVEIEDESDVRDALYRCRRDGRLLRLGSRNSKIVEVTFKIRRVVSAIGQSVQQNCFRRHRVLEVVCPRHPQDAREIREAIERPSPIRAVIP